MLTIITFLWGDLFTARHVNCLRYQCKLHVRMPHRFVCITDKPEGLRCETRPLWEDMMEFPGRPGNFRRLRAFDGDFQRSLGDRIVCMDIDTLILGDITDLMTGPEPFKIMRGSMGRDGELLNPYNGSFWRCDAGAREKFWTTFGPHAEWELNETLRPSGKPVIGSDQAWMAKVSPDEPTFSAEDGLHQYFTLKRYRVPAGARMIFFAGNHNPWDPRVRRTHPPLSELWTWDEIKGNRDS